jgi:hypothetical protein
METQEYLGISLIQVIKELAGRVRLLEELVRSDAALKATYEKQVKYRAAFEEDEYNRLVRVLKEILDRLPEIEDGAETGVQEVTE